MDSTSHQRNDHTSAESISEYFKRIGHVKLLTHDEEIEIGQRIEKEEQHI